MNIFDLVDAKALATYWNEAEENRIPYLGEALFPVRKKMGLDLAWIKGYKGLPVALKPSAFDTKATVRDRIGVTKIETEMPFFREAMTFKEKDRQELLRFREGDEALYSSLITEIYDDRAQLIEGAMVQAERMRMQLLTTGGITISANNVDYTYNFDIDGQWAATNKLELSGTSMWSDTTNSTPFEDIKTMQDKITEETGTKPTRMILTTKVWNYLLTNKSIKIMLNPLAGGANLTVDGELKSLLLSQLGVSVEIYDKKFKTETGETKNFFDEAFVALLPATAIGNTNYGTTPEEADLVSSNFNGDVAIVNTGVAVTTINIPHPVNKETIVSEIVLPSFERMNEVAAIKVVA